MILSDVKRETLKEDADKLLLEVEDLMVKLQLEECLQKLQVLMNDYELLEEYDVLLKCHIKSAICHYNLGDVKVAFSLINEYETLCKQYKRPVNKVDYYPMLGLQYMYKDDFEKSIKYYELAAKSAMDCEEYRLYVTAKKHVAYVATQIGQYELASKAVNDAKECFNNLSLDDINRVEVLLVEIQVYLQNNDLQNAHECILAVKNHPLLTVDSVTYALFYEYYANYYLKAGNYLQAYECANEGLALLNGTGQFVSEHDLYELQVKICQQIEDKSYLIGIYERYVESLKATQNESFSGELAKRDFEDLKKMTEIDNLTGVYNRKYLIERSSEWLNVVPINQDAIICAVFDVDHFKQINDRFGHLTGDTILKELSSKCNALLDPNTMFLARYGGDEFVIIHRTNDLIEGIDRLKAIYHELNQYIIDVDGKQFTLSISMGISYTQIGEYLMFEQLFERADESLYRSKENGRRLLTIS